MLHSSTVTKYRSSGFSTREIANITGRTEKAVLFAERGPKDNRFFKYRACALRMLRRVPTWWQGTAEEYERCVRCNFADVLE